MQTTWAAEPGTGCSGYAWTPPGDTAGLGTTTLLAHAEVAKALWLVPQGIGVTGSGAVWSTVRICLKPRSIWEQITPVNLHL